MQEEWHRHCYHQPLNYISKSFYAHNVFSRVAVCHSLTRSSLSSPIIDIAWNLTGFRAYSWHLTARVLGLGCFICAPVSDDKFSFSRRHRRVAAGPWQRRTYLYVDMPSVATTLFLQASKLAAAGLSAGAWWRPYTLRQYMCRRLTSSGRKIMFAIVVLCGGVVWRVSKKHGRVTEYYTPPRGTQQHKFTRFVLIPARRRPAVFV